MLSNGCVGQGVLPTEQIVLLRKTVQSIMENSIEKQSQPLQMSRSISRWESIQPTGKDVGINLANISN